MLLVALQQLIIFSVFWQIYWMQSLYKTLDTEGSLGLRYFICKAASSSAICALLLGRIWTTFGYYLISIHKNYHFKLSWQPANSPMKNIISQAQLLNPYTSHISFKKIQIPTFTTLFHVRFLDSFNQEINMESKQSRWSHHVNAGIMISYL